MPLFEAIVNETHDRRKGNIVGMDAFIRDVASWRLVLEEFDEKLWIAVVGRVTVDKDGGVQFGFKEGCWVKTQ